MCRLPPLLLVLTCLLLPVHSHAQSLQRCIQPDGTAVFTDRRCEDVGASNRRYRPPTAPAQAGARQRAYLQCPRSAQDMMERVGAAVASGDVNRLGALYLWNGLSADRANQVMDRLETIVRRPLLDIQPILSAPAPSAAADGQAPPAAPPRTALGLELRQGLANTSRPSSTVLGLRRAYDCLWISL